MLDESKADELELALANVETVYENNPTVAGYMEACNLILSVSCPSSLSSQSTLWSPSSLSSQSTLGSPWESMYF